MRGDQNRASAPEPPLRGILAGFRAALRAEIDASQRNAANDAVSLCNGRRVAQLGGTYQYVFEPENLLVRPGATPGDLLLPGEPPVEVIVVSIEGLAVTLSVSVDLGPFVPQASLRTDLTFLMRKLIQRIEESADSENPVGDPARSTSFVETGPPGRRRSGSPRRTAPAMTNSAQPQPSTAQSP